MANRLTDDQYVVPNLPTQNGRYNLGYMNYDQNGNFMSMLWVNELTAGNFDIVDYLTYTYQTNSNNLIGVYDSQSIS